MKINEAILERELAETGLEACGSWSGGGLGEMVEDVAKVGILGIARATLVEVGGLDGGDTGELEIRPAGEGIGDDVGLPRLVEDTNIIFLE